MIQSFQLFDRQSSGPAMGGGEFNESGVAARGFMDDLAANNVPFDDLFENNSTFVGEASVSKSRVSQLPLMGIEFSGSQAAPDPSGRQSTAMYQDIQAIDYGRDKPPSEGNQGIYTLNSCPMDIDSDGFDHNAHPLPSRQEVQWTAGNVDSLARNRLFSLLQIKLDKQDLSFVEKVTLLQGEIYGLCKHVLPNSVRHQGREKYLIEFAKLNNSSLRVVGFYGDKNVMTDIFRTHHIVEASTLRLMEKGEFEPGLYASLRDTTLHVFYWHQGRGHTMPVASRKDISCNFVRYLVELCDTVHICLDSLGLRPLLISASKSTSEKRTRTQRLKISMVKASENDLKFLPGWEDELPLQVKEPPVRSRQTPVSVDVKDVQFTEGYFRAAVLVATPRPIRMSVRKDSTFVEIQDVPKHVAHWQTKHNLDARDLDDTEFTALLKYAKLEGYQGLCDLEQAWKEKQAAQTEREYKIDELRSKEESLVLCIFEKGVSTYLQQHFPWEESLLPENSMGRTYSQVDEQQLQVYCIMILSSSLKVCFMESVNLAI